jgi:hypothetical protein
MLKINSDRHETRPKETLAPSDPPIVSLNRMVQNSYAGLLRVGWTQVARMGHRRSGARAASNQYSG